MRASNRLPERHLHRSTSASTRDRGAPDPFSAVRAALRAVGLRGTAPRIAVLARLRQANAPLSHGDIVDALAPRGFDRATIYRNLIDLTEAGLLRRIDVGDHTWRFEGGRAEGGKIESEPSHPHFVCVDCGSLTCLPEVNVEITPRPGSIHSKIADVSQILLQGRCESC